MSPSCMWVLVVCVCVSVCEIAVLFGLQIVCDIGIRIFRVLKYDTRIANVRYTDNEMSEL